MGFLDDLGKNLNKMGKKTSEMASVAKIKLEITKNKSAIEKKYEELGARIYFLNKEGVERDETVLGFFEEIDELFRNIETLEQEVENVNRETIVTSRTCQGCGAVLKGDTKFCGGCGMKVEEEVQPEIVIESSATRCPECGAEVEGKFCNSCGSSIE